MVVKNSDTLVIIPAYNEEGTILEVVNNLRTNYSAFDYIVINDGSKDKTADICRKNNINLIDLPVNLGLTGAVQAGFKYADRKGYAQALQFDADGQHLPEYISELVKQIENGADCAIGSRFVNVSKNRSLRMLGNTLISYAIRLTTKQVITDPTSGMRIFNKELIKEFANGINYTPEPDTISYLIRKGKKISEVQVQMQERQAGESYLTFSRSIKYMIHMFISILFIQSFRKKD